MSYSLRTQLRSATNAIKVLIILSVLLASGFAFSIATTVLLLRGLV